MNDMQFWSLVGLIVSTTGTLASIMIWITNKHDSDIKANSNKHDSDIKSILIRLDGHAKRIDQLYMMFCDLLKERK